MATQSGHEIEIKLLVADAAEMVRRLRALGAVRGRRVHEVNAVFDTPEQKMRRSGRLLRLRVERPMGRAGRALRLAESAMAARMGRARLDTILFAPRKGRTRGGQALVTLKAPVSGSGQQASGPGYKIRREIEFGVADAAAFRLVLGHLGFETAFYYEKFRTPYRLPGIQGVIVALDETPIGTFLELEGRPRDIDRARELLGYEPREAILLSYGGLNAAYRAARGLAWGDMLFG